MTITRNLIVPQIEPRSGSTNPPLITTLVLPGGVTGQPYSFQMSATGGTPPYTWSISLATPNTGNWLSITAAGVLQGTPTTVETETVRIRVTDSLNTPTAPTAFTLSVVQGSSVGAPSVNAGYITTNSTMIGITPYSGTYPQRYNIYRADVSLTTPLNSTPIVPANNFSSEVSPMLQNYWQEVNTLQPSTSYTYRATQLVNGVESGLSSPLTITTLANGQTATPPAKIQGWTPDPFQVPTGGTTWPVSTDAQMATALASASYGDVISMAVNGTFTQSYFLPAAWQTPPGGIPANPYVYIISANYASLPPIATTGATVSQLTLTAGPAVGATSATLTSNWTSKTGDYPVLFWSESVPTYAAALDYRRVRFTAGSSAISWASTDGTPLSIAMGSSILVGYLPGVTSYDTINMPTIHMTQNQNNNAFTIPGGNNHTRFVGLNITYSGQPNFAAFQCNQPNTGGTPANGGDHIIIDRCVVGKDLTANMATNTIAGISVDNLRHAVSSNHSNISVDSCFFYGIWDGNTDGNGVGLLGGGPGILRNSYLEVSSESFISGGDNSVSFGNLMHDWEVSGNFSVKHPLWSTNRIGQWVKNHFEVKIMQRWSVHDNICWFNWSAAGGQHGRAIVAGARDQTSAGGARTCTGYCVGTTLTILSVSGGSTTAIYQGVQIYNGGLDPSTTVVALNGTGTGGPGTYTINTSQTVASAGAPATFNLTFAAYQLLPYAPVTDCDIYNNWILACGALGFCFTGDSSAVAYTARVRFQNNLLWLWPSSGIICHGYTVGTVFTITTADWGPNNYIFQYNGSVSTARWQLFKQPGTAIQDSGGNTINLFTWGTGTGNVGTYNLSAAPAGGNIGSAAAPAVFLLQVFGQAADVTYGNIAYGPTPDLIWDHNTIINNFNGLAVGNPPFVAPMCVNWTFPYAPSAAVKPDRVVISNNVLDCPNAFALFNSTGSLSLGPAALTNAFTANSLWTNNCVIQDGATYGVNGLKCGGSYSSGVMGFKSFTNVTTPPAAIDSWNVTSGTALTGSTVGGPVGAIFPAPANFPLIGGYLLGNVDFSTVAHIGALGAIVFQNYPGYFQGGKNITQQMTAVKALNPEAKITSYVDIMEIPGFVMSPGQALFPSYTAANNASGTWYLRTTYPGSGGIPTSGNVGDTDVVVDTFGASSINIATNNLSASNDPIAPNTTYPNWYATWSFSWMPRNGDGTYTDNVFSIPRVSGDFLQNGTTQTPAAIQQTWRNAYVAWDADLRATMNSIYYMHWANVADWGTNAITGYPGIWNGGVFELAIPNQESTWSGLMSQYSLIIKSLKKWLGGGPYLIFHQQQGVTDYQSMRYGLGSCMLDNGYFYYTDGSATLPWYDEFNFNLGAPIGGPNNPLNGTFSNGGLIAWQSGVWRRDFVNGIILVNPKGNGSQTVTLETTYWHLRGTQANPPNSATSTTSVTLADRDGLVLSRTAT